MKILILGMGSIGQRHVRNLRRMFGHDLEILAHRVAKIAPVLSDGLEVVPHASMEQTYNLKSYASLEAALECKPNIAFICNPSSHHLASALACARAGCHIFIEKPLCTNVESVDELIRSIEDQKLVAYVGYQYRFHPCFAVLRDVLKEGRLGNVVSINAYVGEHMPHFHRYEDYRQTYAARKDLGGGVIMSQIHELDYLYALFGKPKNIFACGGHLSNLEIDVEDVASVIFEYAIKDRLIPAHVHLNFLQVPARRTCTLVGDQATLEVDFLSLKASLVTVSGERNQSWDFAGKWKRNDMFEEELKHFFDCIAAKSKPLVGIRDGLASVQMAFKIKESIATRSPVEFKDGTHHG